MTPSTTAALAAVGRGQNQVRDFLLSREDRHQKYPRYGADTAVESQLAHHEELADVGDLRAVCAEDPERDGKIESAAFLLNIGRGEVDGDVRGRNQVAGIPDRRANAVAAFAHGRVGQTDSVKVVLIGDHAAVIDFYVDEVGVDAIDGRTEGFEKHESSAASVAGRGV